MEQKDIYLTPTYFIDSDSYTVLELAKVLTQKSKSLNDEAIKLFYWTRDEIRYDPYESFVSKRRAYKASAIIHAKKGWCIQKAVVLAALARARGIPTRLHFADIRNHQAPKKLIDNMGTDVFIYHGYAELFINYKWVKVTPAFNKELCDKFQLKIVEFDGDNDAILPEFTNNGEKYIEYLVDRGFEADLPLKKIFLAFFDYYFSK
jgi:transglutaminase-like putative cysteine protease